MKFKQKFLYNLFQLNTHKITYTVYKQKQDKKLNLWNGEYFFFIFLQTSYSHFQALDERINLVATKVVHLGDQLEGVNTPRARAVEAQRLMNYLDEFMSDEPPKSAVFTDPFQVMINCLINYFFQSWFYRDHVRCHFIQIFPIQLWYVFHFLFFCSCSWQQT